MTQNIKNNTLNTFKEDYKNAGKAFDANFSKKQFTEVDPITMKAAIVKGSLAIGGKVEGKHADQYRNQNTDAKPKQR